MIATLGTSPGSSRYPEHEIRIEQSNLQWEVRYRGQNLASGSEVLMLHESGFEPVAYFPRDQVNQELLRRSDSRTTCPFKGEAHYLAVANEDSTQDIAWFYPKVYKQVAGVRNRIAFYTNLVTISSKPISQ